MLQSDGKFQADFLDGAKTKSYKGVLFANPQRQHSRRYKCPEIDQLELKNDRTSPIFGHIKLAISRKL